MKRPLTSFFVCVLCLWLQVTPNAPAAPSAATAAPDGQRFLFIVETSSDMEPLKDANETAVYDLIVTGLYGQMQMGDTFGMWMFEKETHAGYFPMQVWDSHRGTQLGAIAAAYLSGIKYENSTDVRRMTDLLTTVVRAVSNLNVFIISDGSSTMRGTPFDKAINAEYKKKRRERSSAKRPYVTALFASGGSITNFVVAVAGQPIALPERPAPTLAFATKTAPPPNRTAGVLLSNTPVASATAPAPSMTIPLNQPTSAPAAASGATTQPTSSTATKTATTAPRVMQIVTKSNSVPVATEPGAPERDRADVAQVSGETQTNNPAPVLSAPAPPEPPTSPIAESSTPRSALAAILPAPITVAARELHPEPGTANPAPPTLVQAAALPVPSGPGAGLFLTFGSLLMAAAIFLLFVVFRRLRPAPGGSLITQSMDRH